LMNLMPQTVQTMFAFLGIATMVLLKDLF